MSAFDNSNLIYWIFLGIGVFLLIFIIVFGGGNDDIDTDLDLDFDIGVNAEAEVDIDVDAYNSNFNVPQILGVLGIGKVPLMLLLATDFSLWGLIGWTANVFFGSVFSGWLDNVVSTTILLGSLTLSLVIGGQMAKPLGKVFASFTDDVSEDRLIGCLGTVSTAEIPIVGRGRIGQVDVLDAARNLVTVNAVLPDWAEVIAKRGMKVLVIERLDSCYLVVIKDSTDQDRWFGDSSHLKRQR